MEDSPQTEISAKTTVPWYYRTGVIIIALLAAGPLALPLVWFTPRFRLWVKYAISIGVLALTIATLLAAQRLYTTLFAELEALSQALR